MKKIYTILAALLTVSMSAKDLTGIRFYVNPGHGSFGTNDRPAATIPFPNLKTTGMPDTCGFYESNTNLWKCLYLGEKLEAAGATVLYSRTQCGPWPYTMVDGDYPDYKFIKNGTIQDPIIGWQYSDGYQAHPDYEKYNRNLVEITEEVEANNIDYFISVHSNANTEGSTANFPLMLYRGPDDRASANATDGYEYVEGSYEKAKFCNEEKLKIMKAGIDVASSTNINIRGDWDFYGSSSNRTHANDKTYKGYLGVLKHGASGFLSEGYFHTYQPARHRALNQDYCHMEGLDYYRGIINYYGADKETVGYIVGTVKDQYNKMSNNLYTYTPNSNDQWVPCNGAEVILKKGGVEVARYNVDTMYNGIFVFEGLEPGDDYSLDANCDGFFPLDDQYKVPFSVKANETTYPMIYLVDRSYSSPTITYELNGGVTNDYGWMSKDDMFQACMADAAVTGLPSLAELKEQADPFAPIITPLGTAEMQKILDDPKWDWLEAYIMNHQNADANAYSLTEAAASAGWRYAIAAFFLEMQHASWPKSADFSQAGKVEAFQPAWQHGFANPTEPTAEFVLNAPYKEGSTFDGWYATADFSGKKVKTVNAETTGTLYAKWIEYVPTIAEVKALAVNTQTKLSGVVTFIDGKNVYIQDITGGILLSMAANPTFTVSQSVIVQGTKGLYGGAPQLQGCVEVSAEAGAMPDPIVFEDLNELINDTELKYCAQLVKVPGLTITEYDNYNNPTFFDGIRSAKGDNMVLDPTVFPIGSMVVVTAIADYYNGFRFVGDIAGVEYTSPAKKESYTYPVRNDKYALTNNWIFSNNEDNFAANKPGKTDYVRGMAAKDGIMYFINRETESLVRVDAATGTMLAPLKIKGDHLFQVQGEDGTYKDAVAYKFNDLKFDNAGNCLIGGIMTGIKEHFMIYEVNLETGVATLLIDECLADNPAYADLSCRFDAFGVYGDVTKNGVIMAADANGSWNVFRWQIKNGVVGKGELISILLDPEVDNYLASTATGFGTAPQIAPQDEEGTLFYVDGFNTLPMLFYGNPEDGAVLVDDFINCPHGTTVQNNEGDIATLQTGLNGLQEFQVGEEYFLIMVATHTVSNPPAAFALYKFADENRLFSEMEPLWYFPNDGLGSATIGFRTAVPSVEVNGNTATISIYAVNNGYASYTLTVDDSDAPIRTEETATACDSYTWNGKTYTQSGTYTYTTTAVNGNDSIVTLHLTITPTLYTEETISACDSYVWNGQTYTEGGTYTYTTTSVAGCDSIVTLHLTICHSEVGETEYATICYGENYTWNGQTYSTAGEYSITLSNTSGCDSTVTLQLTILPEMLTTEEYVAICHGETYTWNGQTYSATGEYNATLSNVNGCDSTAILHLTVLPEVIRKTEYISAPTNKTVTWRGKEYNETGTYYDTVHFVVNPLCDSVIYMLDLTIADNIDSDKYCGDNLTWYYSNGALIITGSGAMYDDPDRLTYRDESWYPARVNNIVLPEAITHIGSVAFADCANLTSIVIPSSVTSIGDGAFSWTGLQVITIPASVTDLGEQVFEACNGLHTVLYESEPRSISNQTIHPLIGCVRLDTIIAPAALWHCTTADPALEARYGVPHKARYIEVTDGELTNQAIKYIANNNGAMEILDLTNATNTTLPYGAWSNSYQLSTLYLPQQIEVIPESMVEGARNLSEIAIPATVTEIGNYAFAGCVNVWRMTVEAVIPPKVYENTFDGISRSISVQVPAGSEDLYREAAYWREFFIEHTNNPSPISNCQKLLRKDQILILRNGKVYTTMGQLVNTEE